MAVQGANCLESLLDGQALVIGALAQRVIVGDHSAAGQQQGEEDDQSVHGPGVLYRFCLNVIPSGYCILLVLHQTCSESCAVTSASRDRNSSRRAGSSVRSTSSIHTHAFRCRESGSTSAPARASLPAPAGRGSGRKFRTRLRAPAVTPHSGTCRRGRSVAWSIG